ncbi:MAG: homocysteine S-methyltransferase family protein [Defluviitaleaceae bacterium]|nr:homocysteine S-methyltransferase family protein [Defluviitaleaceae bacterium]
MKKLFFDGGMGTLLHERGLTGDPVCLNLLHGEAIIDIHRQYIHAGADVITANTFGAYTHKYPNAGELISAALRHAQAAVTQTRKEGTNLSATCIAFDMCPLGQMLEPYGDFTYDAAYALFLEAAQTGAANGANMILIETFYCVRELEAAVRAAKTTGLPVFATMSFNEKGRTAMGTSIGDMAKLLEEINADAIGMNCGFGPDVYKKLLPELLAATHLPVLIQPNAGLPEIIGDQTRYNVTPDDFARTMAEIAAMGCAHLGGCCGTTPAHISAMIAACGVRGE